MFQKSFTLLAALLVAGGTTFTVEAAEDNNNYLAFQLNVANVDSERRVDGNGLGASFLYGFPLHGNFSLEARFTGLILERGSDQGTDFYQQDIGVDAVYRFSEFGGGWEPFVLAGIAAIRDDTDIDEEDGINAGMHVGGGVTSGSLGRMGLKFRADIRYVHDQFMEGMQDVRLGLGVEIPLGERSVAGSGTTSRNAETIRGTDDKDGDNVPDYSDRCPNSLPYVRHDEDGCMAPNQTIRLYEVTFNNGTSILTTAAREELASIVRALRGQPNLPVQINGHTDAWGDASENQRLSIERAEAVATYLTLQGIPTQRLKVKGLGETAPVESNSTSAGRERNRRIEIVLLEPPSH